MAAAKAWLFLLQFMHVTTLKAMKQFKPWQWQWQWQQTYQDCGTNTRKSVGWLLTSAAGRNGNTYLERCNKEQIQDGRTGKDSWCSFVFVLSYLAVLSRCPAASQQPVAIELSYRSVAMNALQRHKSPPAASRKPTNDSRYEDEPNRGLANEGQEVYLEMQWDEEDGAAAAGGAKEEERRKSGSEISAGARSICGKSECFARLPVSLVSLRWHCNRGGKCCRRLLVAERLSAVRLLAVVALLIAAASRKMCWNVCFYVRVSLLLLLRLRATCCVAALFWTKIAVISNVAGDNKTNTRTTTTTLVPKAITTLVAAAIVQQRQ